MQDEKYLRGQTYWEQSQLASMEGAHEKFAEWKQAFITRMAMLRIPMHVYKIDDLGMNMHIVHSTKGVTLSTEAWELIAHIGEQVAIAKQLKIQWGGDTADNDKSHWSIKYWNDW